MPGFGRIKSQDSTDPIEIYIRDHSLRLTAVQERLLKRTKQHKFHVMVADPVEMQLLQMVIKMIGAKKTLEIGVYTGYSALCTAMALPGDGRIVACDVSDEYASIGKPFWKEAGVDHKIDLRIAPALETLDKLIENGEGGTFDFAFIDADKINHLNYYERCLKLLGKGGIIVFDNTLWDGDVADPSITDEVTEALRKVNDFLYKDDRVDIGFLRIGDGTTLCRIK